MSINNNLPLTPIINISVSETPQGLQEPNVNAIAIFTTEQPVNPATFGAFQIYESPTPGASDFGTNSTFAAMLNNIFAQTPNVLSGDGYIVGIPLLNAVSATPGNFTTTNISANIATIAAVTNGDLKVTVNGTANNLANLNFTGCSTLAQIATVLENALPAGINVTAVGNTLVFTSDKVGSTSTVALATFAGGGTDLTGAGLLNTAAGAATGGTNSSGETIAQAITRTSTLVGYCGIMTDLNLEDAAISAAAAAVQALPNLFLVHFNSLADIAGEITTIQQATQQKTRSLIYTPSQAAANLMKAAYASRAMSVDFSGSNTVNTMNLKTLANVNPDNGISLTNLLALQTAGGDPYVSFQGVPAVVSTGGNDYFDNQYCLLALQFALQTAAFNYLAQTSTKVPQTEPGMTGFKDALIQVLEQFVTNGMIAPGAWTSSETFGTSPQVFKNNILSKGYYVYSQPVTQQNATDRANRKAPVVQIAAKGAGAIQSANILVFFNP